MQLLDKYPPKNSIEKDLEPSESNGKCKLPSVIPKENEVSTDELAQLKGSETVVS
jgi:hypothetical protein